jgi:cation:H+ antiporter
MAIIGAGIWLSLLGDEIAQVTGWNTSFVGNMFLAITTSLPELVVVAAAVRLGAVDLAVANILGANMLNMLTVTWADVALTDGPILSLVSNSHAVTAGAAIGMSLVVIIAVYRGRGRRGFLAARWYVPLIVGLYVFGSYASFTQMLA